jgi:ubiquinone/menaquinone biosynthesis C-methylase UbiE
MSATAVPQSDPYAFATDRAEEERRLVAQARLFEPITDELLRRAGLGAGMHVIDLGSGAGDTAILAARLVGPTGSVLGVERSPEQAALARRRVADLGFDNVTFEEGDVAALGDLLQRRDGPVDAVIGRLILMWVPDRAGVLRTCATALEPGTLVWFQDTDLTSDYAMPAPPLWVEARRWFLGTIEGLGAECRMGPKLYRAFRDAGLPGPTLETRTIMVGGPEAPVWFLANIFRAFSPLMTQLGIADPADVDIDTLEDRLLAALTAENAAMIVPPFTAAWTRIPPRP